MSPVTLEACVTSLEAAQLAVAQGADRLELCAELAVGGVTPEAEQVTAAAKLGVPVMVLIRCRAGSFCYTSGEVQTMAEQLSEALEAGAAGVVLGALSPEGAVDEAALAVWLERLKRQASAVPVTFHRAFDAARDLPEAWRCLQRFPAITRVLTSGGAPQARQGGAALSALQQLPGPTVLAGGGVRPEHARAVVAATGVTELHFSAMQADGTPHPTRVQQMRACFPASAR